jgi:hypothetical protein
MLTIASYFTGQDANKAQASSVAPTSDTFPVLANTRTATASKLLIEDGPWSSGNVERLMTKISVKDEAEVPPTPGPAQLDPFPQLSNHSLDEIRDNQARILWTNFRKEKGEPVVVQASEVPSTEERNPVPGSKPTKGRGKKKWQPMRL